MCASLDICPERAKGVSPRTVCTTNCHPSFLPFMKMASESFSRPSTTKGYLLVQSMKNKRLSGLLCSNPGGFCPTSARQVTVSCGPAAHLVHRTTPFGLNHLRVSTTTFSEKETALKGREPSFNCSQSPCLTLLSNKPHFL